MKLNLLSLLRTSAIKACRIPAKLSLPGRQKLFAGAARALVLGFAWSANAQITPSVRFTTSQLRATVGLNTTNTITITNAINVSTDIVSAVTFSVSGLPAGASAILTDPNTNALTSTTIDTNLWLTLNLTNIAEGTYTFFLNADGGATNRLPLILQAAHVWNGANGKLEVSNLVWSAASNWFGGVPSATSEVVFGEIGAQTNADAGAGFPFTNSIVDVTTTISSLRFAQTGFTNSLATGDGGRPRFHNLRLNPGVTLTVSGSNSFSLLRDYSGDRYSLPRMDVIFSGGAGSRLVVSNETGNFGMLIDRDGTDVSSLNVSNLDTFVLDVNRMGVGEYQIYPNYRKLNDGFNQGRDTNQYSGFPQRFPISLYLARTNILKAVYKDPDNYTNETTRGYAISQLNGEQSGNGSGVSTFFLLGASNAFLADSVCFVGAGHATGNGGALRFGTNNGTALFRATNGGRMSLFVLGDDAGTNQAGGSNVKVVADFAQLNGLVDILADKLYLSRDRTVISSNEDPTSESTFTMGRGTVDVHTAILGFQEHSNKVDWTVFGAKAYRGYCRGTLNVTNGGTFKVNGNLILGYTADNNPESAAQQFNTQGQITIFSNSTVTASNILVDTGLNFTSILNPRQNNITINAAGILTVTNGMGVAPGLPVDNLNIAAGGILTVFVTPGKTNIIVKNLITPGPTPGIIKIATLPTFPSYPTNIPIISYQSANPFLAADMSAIGGTVQGYIVNNSDNMTIDLFLTTNAPKTLIWSGSTNNNWDLTTKNWLTTNGVSTNFTFGDIATFDDSTTVNNINVTDVVVPNQATNGVIFNNNTRSYTFSAAGGAVAGTAKLVKQGLGNVTFNAAEAGPITVAAGTLNGSGILGAVTVYSNATLSLDTFGTINGGVTSTGTVAIAVSASIASGPVNIRGGTFRNQGFVNASGSMSIIGGALVTNEANAEIDVDTGNPTSGRWIASGGSVLANHGTIKEIRGRMAIAPSGVPFDGCTFFGEGQFLDSDGGLITGNDGRLEIFPTGIWSPGTNLYNSIGTNFVQARVDINNAPNSGVGVLRIEVDFSNPQVNDIVFADKWNNITGMLLMTNINPGAGSFTLGQGFQVFSNTASVPGSPFPNFIDVNGSYPIMSPVVPAPGLQWGLADFRTYGSVTVTNAGLVWDGGINGNWDTNTANWKSGKVYADNLGVMLDDSASGTTTITLTNIIAPIGFILVTNIVGTTTNIITNNPVMSPGLVVSNTAKDYTISGTNGKISGMTGIYKIGSGTLNLLNWTNDFIGNVIINGGTIAVSNTPGTSGILTLGINGSGGLNNEIFIDSGTLKYLGNTNASLPRAMSVGSGGATLNVNSTTNELTPGTIWGAGGLTKTGPGQLALTANANTYSNGTTISQGTLRLANSALGFGGITFAGGTTMILTNAFNFTNAINIAGPGVTWQLGPNTNVLGGAWTGNGTVTTTGTNLGQLILNASLSGFGGVLSLGSSSNSIRFNNSTNNPCLGSSTATFDLGTGGGYLHNMNGGGVTYDLGALSGGSNTLLGGGTNTANVTSGTYSIGANGSNTVFSGRIINGVGSVAITKVGSGSLTLAGSNTYSGGTIVSGGRLLVNNTTGSGTGSGSVSVGSSATLGGNGTISGAVSVAGGGTLSPGTSIGRLTINNSLNLAASSTTIVEVSKNGSVLTNDNVAGLSSVSFNGSLVVSNIGPGALAGGDSFKLFNIGGTGNFTSITPALASPQSWSFNPANGVLTVVDPRVISYSRSGNNITFSWTGTSKLQAQTNTITGTWVDYPGGGTSPVTITVDPIQTDVFFRLAPGP